MRKWLHTLGWMVAVALSATACQDDMYDNSPDEPLKLSVVDTILVDLKAQKVTMGVTARDSGWTMTGSESWCNVDPVAGEQGVTRITVTFTANDADGALDRIAAFTFKSGNNEKSVIVKQLNGDIVTPNENPDSNINKRIFEELKKWYYNGEPNSVAPDYNQSYDDFYFNYLSHLGRNEAFEGNVWARDNERYIYSYIERNPVGTNKQNIPPLNYGMEFDLVEYGNVFAGRILYVERGSPAAAAGLKRGDWFWKVNNTRLGNWPTEIGGFKYHYQRFIDTLVHPVATESPTLGMLSFRASQETLIDEKNTVTLMPANHPNNPILGTQVFQVQRLAGVGGGAVNIGYLMYNNFDPAYRNELIAEFRRFKNGYMGEPLDNFILDLRYNKNGSVEMAELMGNLLVGDVEGVAGKKFAEYIFHDESHNRTAEFAPHADGIGVDTVFVLTSRHTAGAAELLINALRGLDQQNEVKLVVIGEVTQGLAAGMVKRTVSLDPEWEYSAWMLAFRCKNENGQGDYTYGLVPNGGEVSEWQRGDNIRWLTTWGWRGLGSTEDPLVKRAVDIVVGLQLMPVGYVTNASPSQQMGFPREFCFPTNMTMSVND